MRIKTLFSIPDGEKVTEKALRRVLISSICAILLCMTCLVSTTWAWFAVSIENTENIIQIAEWSLDVSIAPIAALVETEEETSPVEYENGVYTLQKGVYNIEISFSSNAQGNDLDQAKVYLIMVENDETKYATTFIMGEDGDYEPIRKIYKVEEGNTATLLFYSTRMNPKISNDLRTADFEVEEEETTPVTTDSEIPGENTDSTEPPAVDETDPAAGSSDDATVTTEASTEPTTAPSTEAATESTETT